MDETTILPGCGAERSDAANIEAMSEAGPCAPGSDAMREASRHTYYAYLTAALAVTVTSAIAARRLFPAAAVRDALAGAATTWDAALSVGALLLSTICAFLAVYVLAFSPFAIPASVGTLALYGAWAGYSFFALAGNGSAACVASAALCAASAAVLGRFAARACFLSPAARRVRFSAFCGRREALRLTLSFFTHSGAAAVLLVCAALILHFGRQSVEF